MFGDQIARHDPQIGDHAEELDERLEDDDHGRHVPLRSKHQHQRKYDEGVAGSEREDDRSSPASGQSGRPPGRRTEKCCGDEVGDVGARHLRQNRQRIPYRVDLRGRDQEHHDSQKRNRQPGEAIYDRGPLRARLCPTLQQESRCERQQDKRRKDGGNAVGGEKLKECLAEKKPKEERQTGELNREEDRCRGRGTHRIAATEMGECDEPVGAGHQQHDKHPEPKRRIVRQERDQPLDQQRHQEKLPINMVPMKRRSRVARGRCASGI